MHAITVAALSGVKVKLLLPGVSDSRFIDFAARSYYEEMLDAGVEIYLYQKGFMHAKTLIIDSAISIVGSANLDIRSLELNFEVNAIVYDTTFSENLRAEFCKDLNDSRKLDPEAWKKRPHYQQLLEKLSRLFSALM
jgi:cardiolipin synthase